jgi:hypothetical protein
MDVFIQITSHPDFDWFQPPSSPVSHDLHRQMLALVNTPFVDRLLGNSPSTFPGASFFALQILGFWLSWMRSLHTGTVQCSR